MKNLLYVCRNFLTLDDLCEQTQTKDKEILSFVANRLLSGPAYELDASVEMKSFFGLYDVQQNSIGFFPKTHVETVKWITNQLEIHEAGALSNIIEGNFRETYKHILKKHIGAKKGFDDLLNDQQSLDNDAVDALLKSEWQSYLKGIYGLCTKTNAFEEIAIKEVCVRQIDYFMSLGKKSALHFDQIETLLKLVDELDRVSAAFAPHEFDRSSRYRCIDKVRAQY